MQDWDLSCPDWWERLQAGRSLVPTLPLWRPEAQRAVAIFRRLKLADVPGTPTTAEAGGAWFEEIMGAMFGAVNPASGERMLRELFALVPKKNVKTTFGALGMTTALLMNQRPRANFLMTAPQQDVAETAFDAAAGAIDLDPVLDKKFHVRHHLKTIVHRETKAALEIITFDPAALTGYKVSGGALIDELHVCAKMSKAAKALRQIRGGMLPFPGSFLWFITTQSDEAPVGVFADELTKAREIRDGKRTGKMLPILYEFPKEVQEAKEQPGTGLRPWERPEMWPLLNPNIGKAITLDRMREEYQDAKDKSEEEIRSWASQHLNIQIGVALTSGGWAGADFWQDQGREEVTLDYLLEWSEVVDFGIDGGGLDDLLGAAAIGRHKTTGAWLHWAHAWAHTSVLDRRKDIAAQLLDFAADGDLTIVGQVGEDVDELAEIAARFENAGLLDKIGVDQAGLGGVLDALEAAGVPAEKVVGISQGWKMMGAMKTAERRLAKGDFLHGATRLMAWCVGNTKTEPVGNAVYITKRVSGTAKIDPLLATLNAVTLMALNPAAPEKFDFAAAVAPMRLRYR